MILNSLPESDVDFITATHNKTERNRFIEESFLKAINFNGKEGYDLEKGCLTIIGNATNENYLISEENMPLNEN